MTDDEKQARIEQLIAAGKGPRDASKVADLEQRIAAGEFDQSAELEAKPKALKAEVVDQTWDMPASCDCDDCTATRKKEAAAAKRRAKKASSGAQ